MNDAREAMHLGLTAILAWMAFRLGITPNVFATSSSFEYMARFAPEHTWAILFLLVANVGLFGLLTEQSVIRLISVLVIATAHGILAGCLLMSDANVWSGTYAIIAVMGYYLAYRRSRAGL